MSLDDNRVDEYVSNQTPGAEDMDLDYGVGATTSADEYQEEYGESETELGQETTEFFDEDGLLEPDEL